ncbi:MAG: DNA repair protein RadA [Actinomycetota bacterium]
MAMAKTAKAKVTYRCSSCGTQSASWVGRCTGCGEWGTVVEHAEVPAAPVGLVPSAAARPLGEIDLHGVPRWATGVEELDRVLGGGLIGDSVTLVGGEPGIGKSTLLLQAVAGLAGEGARVLYVSAEESAAQVRARAVRLELPTDGVWLASSPSVPEIVAQLDELAPDVVVVDSIQTVHHPESSSLPGSPSQVRECAQHLVREAKSRGLVLVLVGHVTKDGALAGPRVLEHVVDTVLSFDGDRHTSLRLLRAVKHRFGGTDELGVFEMTTSGLRGVTDPSALFLADRRDGVPGSVVVPVVEGHRPLLVETQALVVRSGLPQPRRTAHGVDASRLGLLLAVLDKRAGVRLVQDDVYAATSGGVRVVEPAADLALLLACASSKSGATVGGSVVACGEVGLGGEIRRVPHLERRLAEAARLGFRSAVVPASCPEPPEGLRALRVEHVAEALELCGLAE